MLSVPTMFLLLTITAGLKIFEYLRRTTSIVLDAIGVGNVPAAVNVEVDIKACQGKVVSCHGSESTVPAAMDGSMFSVL